MRRRQTLESLLAPKDEDVAPAEQTTLSAQVTSGALKAMGLSLRQMQDAAGKTRELEEKLHSGEYVVDIDPAAVDASFVEDRIAYQPSQDAAFGELTESIREHGQQVPILVRAHPTANGRYQVAYGHRRLRAAAELKRPVKAFIRNMSDAELVIAQGKENLERQDLSFIERAVFADNLEAKGFDRKVIMSALGVAKGDLSSLISISRGVPKALVEAIGPAPKIGKPRWLEMASKLHNSAKIDAALAAMRSGEFAAAETNRRFVLALSAVTDTVKRTLGGDVLSTDEGLELVRVVKRLGQVSLHIDEKAAPNFSSFLIKKLPEIYAAFRKRGLS
jgi:ParB family transcriptional regulator, chromosome partitioning protein